MTMNLDREEKDEVIDLTNPAYYINRELNWLDFNFRVLAEAENEEVPLAERLKFLAIVSSNNDEFFMIRVANLKRAIANGEMGPMGPDRLTPRQILAGIVEKTHEMVQRQYACLDQVILPRLAKEKIYMFRTPHLTEEDKAFLSRYFDEELAPILTPMAVDPGHPFPLLQSGSIYILFRLRPRDGVRNRFFGETDTVLMQMPPKMNRFVRLPSPKDTLRVAVLNDILCLFANRILGGYTIEGAYPFRVLRDAEMTLEDEPADDLITAVETELRRRRWGAPVRLEIWRNMPESYTQYLREKLDLQESDIYRVPSLLDLKSLFSLIPMIDRPHLFDPPWPPQPHPALAHGEDLYSVIRERDLILHLPYQSFDPVIEFLNRAAEDKEVLAIKITLYRVSGDSPVVRALIRAAENGKQVTALVELRARFDEEANIEWARRLSAAGAHVIYGVVGYKTHAKVCLVIRREADGIRRYVHLSTGNYNDKTARVYTDIGYFTARPEFGADISAFFNVITGYSLPPHWNRITMAPTGLRAKTLALIEREIAKHTPETPGWIRAKMNSLVDPEIIAALYRASQAGVRIDLVVRGLCRLRPGVPGLSENITVTSILDRFLEHSRIFHYRNGGNEEVYLSSADWMERNFDTRLELLFPILDPQAKAEVLGILDAALADNVKAWKMQPDGDYLRVTPPEDPAKRYRSQERLYRAACRALTQASTTVDSRIFQVKTQPDFS